jgi:type VI protein secretion system component VasF
MTLAADAPAKRGVIVLTRNNEQRPSLTQRGLARRVPRWVFAAVAVAGLVAGAMIGTWMPV